VIRRIVLSSGPLAALLLVLAAAALTTACNVNDYCINCADDDGDDGDDDGVHDAAVDASDGSAPPDACIQTGAEVCNGLDDDCDGTTDEEPTDVGGQCGVDVGQCTIGVMQCVNGERTCDGEPATAETCDGVDNDCDGAIDNGNPQGGQSCGTDTGECVAGVMMCLAGGVLDCVGDSGAPGQAAELCDGKDNDCDGQFDEGITTQGPCGFPSTGECESGVLTCVGGAFQCVGGAGPTFELCDALDQDCDGNPINGYDLAGDVRNCGSCGHSCVGTLDHATERCTAGACDVASCDPDYWDVDHSATDGCEYGPCEFQGPVESCNQTDDDCDSNVDENLTAPANFCDPDGACAGTTPSCTAGGWDCVYGGAVSTDGNGDIAPETACDGIDNDCDGRVDESHPDIGDSCAGTGNGVCQSSGHLACDAAHPNGPTVCVVDTPGGTSSAEVCDDLDNDCDGNTDEGATSGNLQAWISIGGGRQIMQYEASHPDARSNEVGSKTGYACSRPGVKPWTSVTQPQAKAACAAIGARLCTEQEWHRACSVVAGTTYPIAQAPTGDAPIFLEVEDYFSRAVATSGGVVRAWVPDYTAGYSGISALRASPNTGAAVALGNAAAQSPRLSFQVNFTQATGNTYVWVRMYSPNNADDQVHVGIASTETAAPTQSLTTTTNNLWVWVRTPAISVSPGTRFVNLFMQDDGAKIDAVVITRNATNTAPTTTTTAGGHWSYAASPNTYQGTVCNGVDRGANAILTTGQLPSCMANGAGSADVFDLSGNVKEWTLERTPGVNPIRGGAYNNQAEGISCSLAFTAADDTFFFDNVGFRCCR